MKKYVVRLLNYEDSVIDGEVYKADDPFSAFNMYLTRCKKLGIQKCVYDKYSIEELARD